MKARELREKLKKEYTLYPLKHNTKKEKQTIFDNTKSFLYKSINKEIVNNEEDNLKIIGISGSKGKSSVAYLLHNMLLKLGKESILYSSIHIDSKCSYKGLHAVENPLRDKEMLLNAINEALESKAEYLILEVNEKAINEHIIDDVEFDIKVLTNVLNKHNNYLYKNYEEIKKSFLLNNNSSNTKLIFSLTNDNTLDLYNKLNNKIVVTSDYFIDRFNLNINNISYLIKANEQELETINGINFDLFTKTKKLNIKSNLLMVHNTFNIALCYAILDTLGLSDESAFLKEVKDIIIPGRCEEKEYKNIKIIVSYGLDPELASLKRLKEKGQINNIRVVSGASGLGYKTWNKIYSSNEYIDEKIEGMNFAYNYIEKNADCVYITTSDSGATNKQELLDYQASRVNKIEKQVYENRKYAIYKAITDSKEKDVIFISGRGNREIMCDGYDSVSLFLDSEKVDEILQDMENM